MKPRNVPFVLLIFAIILFSSVVVYAQKATGQQIEQLNTTDMNITEARVVYQGTQDQLIFRMAVDGIAGETKPEPAGQLNGAPVLGYVFPTTLSPTVVGFGDVKGILALAITSHPDFDDTPLWDENGDHNYENDGKCYHTHWVVLGEDNRVEGGLSVREFKKEDQSVILPPTNPGMPMYLDSPGFPVVFDDNMLSVVVPAQRVSNETSFNYDGATAYMEVSTEKGQPMLGVYKVFKVSSGDLSLPYSVQQ
ncbi:hypothetical protein SAMN05443144_102132 [Fodinibius roseus]|uniref:Uncharacterized protein n=1 Tax=Fodinibius roseus TaxID=1194090 RepID=A0A1M4UV74_9BACT|nr:hypothetical protein [Fodinibius roseus]SHE60523.1 hypothetical protein SAMN05443144_102132 [Fodinibius roseus]